MQTASTRSSTEHIRRRQSQNSDDQKGEDFLDHDHVPGSNYDILYRQSREQYDRLLAETEILRQQCFQLDELSKRVINWVPGAINSENKPPELVYPHVDSRSKVDFEDFSIVIDPYIHQTLSAEKK